MPEYIVNADQLIVTSSVSIPYYLLSLPKNERIEEISFIYNYYTRNEGVSEEVILDSFDAESDEYEFIVENWEKGAKPRLVKIGFTSAGEYETEDLSLIFGSNTIKNAYDQNKIIYEDAPFSDKFVSIYVNDTSIDQRIYRTLSSIGESNELESDFLNSARLQSSGYRFSKAQAREQIVESYKSDVKAINLGISINSLICSDLVNTVKRWQTSAFVDEFASTFDSLASIQSQKRAEASPDVFSITESDLDVTVPTIATELKRSEPSSYTKKVGYIIEKYGEQLDGTTLKYDDVVIEDPTETSYSDLSVRYGGVYKYRVRTVYRLLVTVLDESTSDVYLSSILVASEGVQSSVQCVENIPPNPPVNISFQQTLEGLYIRWNFPVNTQKDIKRFQVFRRRSIDQPFHIIREIKFDKTILPYSTGEKIPPQLVDVRQGPVKHYLDEDFNSLDSDYIYAICAVDAHGLSSSYSDQFRVRFDRLTGKILITRISSEGAPKPYPNVKITGDFFSDIIKDSGHTRMRIYFDPEYVDVTKMGESLSLISTTTTGATTYKICLTELNLAKSQTVDIVVGDNRIGADGIPVSIAKLYTAG